MFFFAKRLTRSGRLCGSFESFDSWLLMVCGCISVENVGVITYLAHKPVEFMYIYIVTINIVGPIIRL